MLGLLYQTDAALTKRLGRGLGREYHVSVISVLSESILPPARSGTNEPGS